MTKHETGEPPSRKPLLILPTYEEAAGLLLVLDRIFEEAETMHVLVVDDASPDGTAEIARSHPRFQRQLFLIERSGKQGLGSAYRDGFAWALARDYTAVIEMDADLSHDPADIARLLEELESGSDLAVGSRYVQGISVIHWPLSRLLLSIGAGVYTRLLTGLPLSDPTSGFKAIRRNALEVLVAKRLSAEGYGFQIELHYWAHRAGMKIKELPIVFTERRDGQSKMSFAIAMEAVGLVARLGLRRISGG